MSQTNYLSLFFKGMAMGAADVVPGVSGGTIAFISGIYEELLQSISSINFGLFNILKTKGIKGVWQAINGRFLLTLGSGILVSLLSLAKLITWLLANKPILVWSFFFGLIIASTLLIVKQIKQFSISRWFMLIVGIAIAYYIANIAQVNTEMTTFYLFLSGAVAICAMILPGISGAFILVLMGSYGFILNAVHNLDLKTIITVGLGAITGLLLFSKGLSWTFNKYKDLTLALLSGFLIGSLTKVWPWKKTIKEVIINNKTFAVAQKNILPNNFSGDAKIFLAIIAAIFGFLIIYILESWTSKKA